MSSLPLSLVDLQHLRLDDARALLARDLQLELPSAELATAESSVVDYLQKVIDGLCELSLKDPLTGLVNRRHFRTVLDRAIDVVARNGGPALLLMLDIDHFKKVNDSHGHHAGDVVLQAVAQALTECVRPMDTVARYGGEEFAVVLPHCHAGFGTAIAERIRQTIEELAIPIAPTLTVNVTVSIGGAFAPDWVRTTVGLWTERADQQLYRAKAAGRNQVFLDEPLEVFVSAEEKSLLFGPLAGDGGEWGESFAAEAGEPAHSSGAQGVN